MGLTERHWFENEDVPENYEWALEDAVYNSRATKKGSEIEMTKLEKVIKALELCTSKIETRTQIPCETCPYHNREYHGIFGDGCCNIQYLHDDILSLLKVQEPQVLTLEEFQASENNPKWLETKDGKHNRWTLGNAGYEKFYDNYMVGYLPIEKYGKYWRCWTTRPTDAQREATIWN